MSEISPIYIASKNRRQGKTMQLLSEAGIDFDLFVETQDYSAYDREFGHRPGVHINILREDNRGLAYARQSILSYARTRKVGWFWMLDDDIDGFYLAEHGKTGKTDARAALEGAQRIFAEMPGVAQAGLEYQQFAWSANRAFVLNSYCDVAVCLHSERVGLVNFRPETDLKCDRDFTLQILAQGYRVVKVQRYAFSAPKNGSNQGGLKQAYDESGRELASSLAMVELWPGVCEYREKPDGRPDVKINWRAFEVL